jgi:hypothetical protein
VLVPDLLVAPVRAGVDVMVMKGGRTGHHFSIILQELLASLLDVDSYFVVTNMRSKLLEIILKE